MLRCATCASRRPFLRLTSCQALPNSHAGLPVADRTCNRAESRLTFVELYSYGTGTLGPGQNRTDAGPIQVLAPVDPLRRRPAGLLRWMSAAWAKPSPKSR